MFHTAWKGLLGHKFRFVATALAVTLGVAFMAGTLVLTDTIRATFDNLFADVYQGTDAVVRAQGGLRGARRAAGVQRGRRRRRAGRHGCAGSTAWRRPRATSAAMPGSIGKDGQGARQPRDRRADDRAELDRERGAQHVHARLRSGAEPRRRGRHRPQERAGRRPRRRRHHDGAGAGAAAAGPHRRHRAFRHRRQPRRGHDRGLHARRWRSGSSASQASTTRCPCVAAAGVSADRAGRAGCPRSSRPGRRR